MTHRRIRNIAALAILGLVAAAGLIEIGRLSVSSRPASKSHAVDPRDDYFAGLRAGEAQGRQEGRALQEGVALPPHARRPVHEAFNAGYAAGANDVFAGYDGGWTIGQPYVVIVAEASGQVVYRIKTRDEIMAHTNYYLCPNGHELCEEPRP
jgi:hypothetical protein